MSRARDRGHRYERVTRCYGACEIAQPVGPRDRLSGEPADVEYRECPGCRDCRGVERVPDVVRARYRDEREAA